MGYKNLLIVEKDGPWKLNCMSKKISLTNFCNKELGQAPSLLYGKIDEIDKKVSCVTGQSVRLVLQCDSSHSNYCKNKVIGCDFLKPYYANNLESMHQSLSSNEQGKVLTCYYSKKINDEKFKLDL